ncbi:MAG TPA: glutathione S-transferase family protein [Candidatus Binatia bacterium]|jgi:glutathione S-transferase|nr:glutathione S-transferase family protein [Candidatus Binatia bacterium]
MPTVYGVNLSPFVRKVRVVLAEKNVSYELIPVFGAQAPPEFREMSPLGKVPAFRDGDRTLCDSTVIVAYLERAHPTPPVYPADPYDYARALWFEEYGDTALVEIIGPKIFFPKVVGPRFMGQEVDEAAADKAYDELLPKRFDYLEKQLGDGPYLVGNTFSIADIAIASPLVNLGHAGYSVDAKRWPKLAQYTTQIHARPTFVTAITEERGFLGL